jgi:2-polyprenyl-6-hydroxyphenyl methylase/3-demethylubiquinone-9 3-methyltransferase
MNADSAWKIIMPEYHYEDAEPTWSNNYLWPRLKHEIYGLAISDRRAFDLGCGSGATAGMLSRLGFAVTGVDPSESGIAIAEKAYPSCRFHIGGSTDDLSGRFGTFPLVVSLEVVEHCYDPRGFARTLFGLVEPGGTAIVSTPYHGYLKNLALALTGRLDAHFTALWDGGHIKFFSIATFSCLLEEAGFHDIRFLRVGRLPALAKSMVAVARRTSDDRTRSI